MEIRFGTDGWRGLIAQDFTFSNLEKVVSAIAHHLEKTSKNPEVIIGYDTRFLAREFASRAAGVLNRKGIKVYLGTRPQPTPAVAAGILDLKADGALMFTASHNPPQYSGLKFIPRDAAPALPEVTEDIEKELAELQGEEISIMDREEAIKQGLLADWDGKKNYLQRLRKTIDCNLIEKTPTRVIISPLFGAGQGYLEEFLGEFGWRVEVRESGLDPYFGGSMPDPSEDRLKEMAGEVKNTSAKLGLALDGDGDRFGIIDEEGFYLTPNQFLFLAAYYLFEGKKMKGNLGRTVATTHLLDRIAKEKGLEIIETPVGFKYIGDLLKQGKILLGGEESGGMSISSHLPEKDGLLACEMISFYGKSLGEILYQAYDKFGFLASRRFDLAFERKSREPVLEGLKNLGPGHLDGEEVVQRNTTDGVKLILTGGDWVLLRPSGTEPLVRLYVESREEQRIPRLAGEIRGILGI